MSTTTARPRQTTMAGVMVMLGAAFIVLSVWEEVSRLRSVESREFIERVITDVGAGTSVETGIRIAHAIAIGAALCAVAAVALGWEVLQRNRVARVALSVVAVPLFLAGTFFGGFAAALVAAATAFLWLSPSREWFAGQPIPEPDKRASSGMQVWEQSGNRAGRSPDRTADGAGDRPADGDASSPDQPSPPPASSAPAGWSVSASATDERPGPVTVALVLTIVVASVVFVTTLAGLVLMATQPEALLEEMRRQYPSLTGNDVPDSQLVAVSYVSNALILLWSALAIALAIMMALRRAWAARALRISAAVCAVLGVIATLASPIAVVPAVAAVATLSCLRRPDVRAWFDRSDASH